MKGRQRKRIEFWFDGHKGCIACAEGWMDSPTMFGIAVEAEHCTKQQFAQALAREHPDIAFTIERRTVMGGGADWFAGPAR